MVSQRLPEQKVDIGIGLVIATFGAYSLFRALELRFYQESVPGPGFFPAVLALFLILGGLGLSVTRLMAPDEDSKDFDLPSTEEARRSVGLWGALLLAIVLVNFIGFLLAMIVLVAVLLLGIERRRGIATFVTIILVPVLVYLLFATLLKVPLPTGFGG